VGTLVAVVTPARLLRLLNLLSARPWWAGPELAGRLEVTERTLRRDVSRLRGLGYPIEGTTGPYGGYRLGAAGHLPPLLLDDDEAVAVAVALRSASGGGASGLESAALSALTKLDQVLPVRLRERIGALRSVTVALGPRQVPPVDLDVLVPVAVACRRPERLRFSYQAGDGTASERHVEPYRLVYTDRRWYLVAFDRDRDAWRTFRVDRMNEPHPTGVPFDRTDPPDAAALVAHGVALAVHALQARIRLHVPPEDAARLIAPTDGVIERESEATTIARVGGDADWIAGFVAGLPCRAEVLEPEEVRIEVRRLGGRLAQDHA
jgi:predicted DNA-binding transcriptional regulator YafY